MADIPRSIAPQTIMPKTIAPMARSIVRKTAVWWDTDSCPIPESLDAKHISKNISSALRTMNYCDQVSINVFGEKTCRSLSFTAAMKSAGIEFIPTRAENASRIILESMLAWSQRNPPPSIVMLISGDETFSEALRRLKEKGCNILLAYPQRASSSSLIQWAKIVWHWTTLSAGGRCLAPLGTSNLEKYVSAKSVVLWDIKNCAIPTDVGTHRIRRNIISALVKVNYCGPVTIYAYGDKSSISLSSQHALDSARVELNHVPAGVKAVTNQKIIVDMFLWTMDNPAPANIMLISGDTDFSYALQKLSDRKYNILLARPRQEALQLLPFATTIWLWKDLSIGGNHFLQN